MWEVGGWGRDPFSRNFMKPTPRRKWYLTTGRRFHWMVLDPIPQSLPVHFLGSRPQPPTSPPCTIEHHCGADVWVYLLWPETFSLQYCCDTATLLWNRNTHTATHRDIPIVGLRVSTWTRDILTNTVETMQHVHCNTLQHTAINSLWSWRLKESTWIRDTLKILLCFCTCTCIQMYTHIHIYIYIYIYIYVYMYVYIYTRDIRVFCEVFSLFRSYILTTQKTFSLQHCWDTATCTLQHTATRQMRIFSVLTRHPCC